MNTLHIICNTSVLNMLSPQQSHYFYIIKPTKILQNSSFLFTSYPTFAQSIIFITCLHSIKILLINFRIFIF